MLFSSLVFIFCFLPAFLILYFAVPERFKNGVLLFFSLIFYAWGEPVYVLLMIYSITVNFLLGRAMEKYPEKKKGTFVFTVIINLFILGFFKYYGFLTENINALFGLHIPIRKIALPIGISFYTFQTLS
ncbi:MAG: MBOAT family protein, partial [Lachnospiraceae bacterium]|nr:MBOAT family protein [Lachnospiraceae bacterium]